MPRLPKTRLWRLGSQLFQPDHSVVGFTVAPGTDYSQITVLIQVLQQPFVVINSIGFMHLNDVFEAISIEVNHRQSVAAGQVWCAQGRVIDDVLAPGDLAAVAGSGCAECLGNAYGISVTGRRQQ